MQAFSCVGFGFTEGAKEPLFNDRGVDFSILPP